MVVSFTQILPNCFYAAINSVLECGSSIYVQPVAFEGLIVIKAGTLDGGAADIEISIERFIQNRNHYCTPVEGAVQAKRME